MDSCLLQSRLSAPQPEAYSPHAFTVTAHRPIQAKEQLSHNFIDIVLNKDLQIVMLTGWEAV